MSCSMVWSGKIFFFSHQAAPKNSVTYRPSWVTEVDLQPPHGPNDGDNGLNGVTVDDCFVLFTFLFRITSFMNNSTETKRRKRTLTSFYGRIHLKNKFNVLNLLTSFVSQLYFSQIHQHLKKKKKAKQYIIKDC